MWEKEKKGEREEERMEVGTWKEWGRPKVSFILTLVVDSNFFV